jgi:4-hydroxythreonine-4-phosphate dehydrogenase
MAPVNRVALAITSGEPAGIGPSWSLLAQRCADAFAARLVILGDRAVLAARAARIEASPRFSRIRSGIIAPAGGVVEIWHQPVSAPVTAGQLDPTNAHSVIAMLEHAADACATGAFAALVTALAERA